MTQQDISSMCGEGEGSSREREQDPCGDAQERSRLTGALPRFELTFEELEDLHSAVAQVITAQERWVVDEPQRWETLGGWLTRLAVAANARFPGNWKGLSEAPAPADAAPEARAATGADRRSRDEQKSSSQEAVERVKEIIRELSETNARPINGGDLELLAGFVEQAAATLEEKEAENANLSKALEEARGALMEAGQTFRFYESLHAAKPDPAKAQRNADLAARMEAAMDRASQALTHKEQGA